MKHFSLILISFLMIATADAQEKSKCTADCCKKKTTTSTAFQCKLTTPELRERKATVVAGLKKKLVEKKELTNSYAYKFSNTNSITNELNSFMKDEKQCCDFLTLKYTVSADKKDAWLEITGADGVKEFIDGELEM